MKRINQIYNVERKKLKYVIIGVIIIAIIIIIICYANNKENPNNIIESIKIINGNDNKTTSKTYESGDLLLNPGKGFVLRDSLDDSCDEVVSVVYYRVGWSTIEPEEGKYNWSIIDSKIEDCAKRGKKFAFGIMNVCVSAPQEYVTPKWVFDAGAKYHIYEGTNGNKQVIPEWTDEIFLEKLNNFINELAERYDGNENIAYIDIRSYGSYGEQHLTSIGGTNISSEQLRELYIQPYMDAFDSTLLVNPWGQEMYNDTYKWAVDNGITIRRDGIMQLYNGKQIFDYAYGKLPTIFEYFSSYNNLKENGLWDNEKLLDYVENWKPSYIEFFPEMYEDNPEFCNMIANKIGYYFRFKEAEFTNTIEVDSSDNISLKFTNEGVAPLYEDCTVYIGLLDENYNLVKKYKTDIDPHTWMPDEEKTENINVTFADIEPGNYIISLGLLLNEDDENPTYLLGNSGKTDDKWYVFGELNITEKQEQYNINLENNEYFVNNNDGYMVNVTADRLNQNHTYTIERYINNTLIENVNITDLENTYNNSFEFKLSEGNNTIRIIIKRDGEEVSKLEKNIYVYSAQENLTDISNTALSGYSEFEEKFSSEIELVPGLSSEIESLKSYMTSLNGATTESEEVAKQKMASHYNLGNMILDAYRNRDLNIEYVTISSMLDMLNDIGNSYEDLVTVSAVTRESYYTATDELISSAENVMDINSDLNIVYPSKILDFAKELDEKSEYINSLTEENDIKTGLIVSNSLHAYYLADWANEFAMIYRDEYVEANPVTVSYSNTSEWTNEDVIATLNIGDDSKVTNNNGSNTYTFNDNGTFTFEYERRGQAYKIEASVSNIDKEPPTITGVEDRKIYTNSAKPVIEDDNIESIFIRFNDTTIDYEEGLELTEEGIYNITAMDKAGNVTTMEFYVVDEGPNGYIIKDNYILNVWQKTSLTDFEENFNLHQSYTIKRNDVELTDTDIVATGDILELSSGDKYTIIVAGDINANGRVSVFDLSILRRYILRLQELTELQALAADINVDGRELTVQDYSRMRIEILGIY